MTQQRLRKRIEADGVPVECAHTHILSTASLKPNPKNPNHHPLAQIELLAKVIKRTGWRNAIVVSKRSGLIVKGHGRLLAAQHLGLKKVPVDKQAYESEAQEHADLIADNHIPELSEISEHELAALIKDMGELPDVGDALELTGYDNAEIDNLLALLEEPVEDAEIPDAVVEVPENARTKPGDIYTLGKHRLMCGDSTDPASVAKLLGKEAVDLIHSDPPYGMGKAADGVANDNLYREKLDAFQQAWWDLAIKSAKENASAYIWGNAPDLWRWWYSTLGQDPALLVRNEIVWDKQTIAGMASDLMHQYPMATERCLFLMRGTQFLGNVNKADYFEGFEPIRQYMIAERKRMGWKAADVNKITGTNMAGHWHGKSQFQVIAPDHYAKLQDAAGGKAYEKTHEELQALFDSGDREQHTRGLSEAIREKRSFFDNAHDIMTDVWRFSRVVGEDRYGHATPKPVDMIVRCLKSSCPPAGVVYEPFGGTGTTIIAAEHVGARCCMMELQPQYCDVVVRRYAAVTGENEAALFRSAKKTGRKR